MLVSVLWLLAGSEIIFNKPVGHPVIALFMPQKLADLTSTFDCMPCRETQVFKLGQLQPIRTILPYTSLGSADAASVIVKDWSM